MNRCKKNVKLRGSKLVPKCQKFLGIIIIVLRSDSKMRIALLLKNFLISNGTQTTITTMKES